MAVGNDDSGATASCLHALVNTHPYTIVICRNEEGTRAATTPPVHLENVNTTKGQQQRQMEKTLFLQIETTLEQ